MDQHFYINPRCKCNKIIHKSLKGDQIFLFYLLLHHPFHVAWMYNTSRVLYMGNSHLYHIFHLKSRYPLQNSIYLEDAYQGRRLLELSSHLSLMPHQSQVNQHIQDTLYYIHSDMSL